MMLALNLVMLPIELLLITPFTTLGAKVMNATQPGNFNDSNNNKYARK